MQVPRPAPPGAARRTEVVAAVVESLEGIEERSVPDQYEVLAEAQRTLAAVLDGRAASPQLTIPGVPGQP